MKKILVIEDNETNMYMMRFMLTENGYNVVEERDGKKGVETALSELPDLILMDIQLPGMDGLEATKKIRGSKRGKTIPIVALTSYAMVGDREKSLAAGCTGYIEKPIDPETFMSEITKFFN